MKLKLLKGEYSIYQFCPEYNFDSDIFSGEFISITKTCDELSVVANQGTFKDFLKADDGWNIIKIDEILDLSMTGVISKISTILANEKINIFVISTFNTDYILIKKENIEKALSLLTQYQYIISEGDN